MIWSFGNRGVFNFRKFWAKWSKKLQGREGSPCSAEQVDLSMFHEPSWKQVYAGRCSEEATLNEQAVQRTGKSGKVPRLDPT